MPLCSFYLASCDFNNCNLNFSFHSMRPFLILQLDWEETSVHFGCCWERGVWVACAPGHYSSVSVLINTFESEGFSSEELYSGHASFFLILLCVHGFKI